MCNTNAVRLCVSTARQANHVAVRIRKSMALNALYGNNIKDSLNTYLGQAITMRNVSMKDARNHKGNK